MSGNGDAPDVEILHTRGVSITDTPGWDLSLVPILNFRSFLKKNI